MFLNGSKLIFSGNYVEQLSFDGVTHFDNPERNIYRTKRRLKRLVNANAFQHKNELGGFYTPLFVTLTFNNKNYSDDVYDLSDKFRTFIKRFNYHIFCTKKAKLKYINVFEFGEKNGRLHCHCIFFNVPFIDGLQAQIQEIWGNGYIYVVSMIKGSDIGGYISKYISKNISNEKKFPKGFRRYTASRNLFKPIEVDFMDIGYLESLEEISETYGYIFAGNILYEFQDIDFGYRLYDVSKTFLKDLTRLRNLQRK